MVLSNGVVDLLIHSMTIFPQNAGIFNAASGVLLNIGRDPGYYSIRSLIA
jgi:hypothetical protein